jgi:hypothetical protein
MIAEPGAPSLHEQLRPNLGRCKRKAISVETLMRKRVAGSSSKERYDCYALLSSSRGQRRGDEARWSDSDQRTDLARSPLPEGRVVGGSRFWALAGESSDEEDGGSGDLAEAECPSPRSGPATVSLGDFLYPAWQLVRGSKIDAAGRRRRRFAPGGRGSRLLQEVLPRNPSLERHWRALGRFGRFGRSSLRWCPRGRWSVMCHRHRCQCPRRPRRRAKGMLLRWVQGLRVWRAWTLPGGPSDRSGVCGGGF